MKNWKAHLALVFVTIFYGANYNIAKDIMPDNLQPFTLTFLRISVVTILFWLVHFFMKSKEKIEKQDYIKLFICGVTGVATNQIFFLWGLSLTSPINASIIVVTAPIFVLLFSYFMINEKINLKKLIGIFLGLIGSCVLIIGSKNTGNLNVNLKGDILMALNIISFSFYLVYVKKLMAKYQPITVVKWVFLFGLIAVTPVAFKDVAQTNWTALPLNIWLSVFYVVVFATFGTYFLNMFALKRVNASVVGIYIYFQVVIATSIAVYLGKDSLDFIKIISCLLIFTAVLLVGDFKMKKKNLE